MYRPDRLKRALRHPRTEWEVTKAKRRHRKLHPKCAITGLRRDPRSGDIAEVHHRIPVHVAPGLACDPDNLVTLLPSMHFWAGHCRDWHDYNSNLDETIKHLRHAYWQHSVTVQA